MSTWKKSNYTSSSSFHILIYEICETFVFEYQICRICQYIIWRTFLWFYEMKNQHRRRVIKWKASLFHDVKVKSKNNKMIQMYYTKRLLFVYVKKIYDYNVFFWSIVHFSTNNNFSHDTWIIKNVIRTFKVINWIVSKFIWLTR